MKNSNKQIKIKCADVEQLLIKQSFEQMNKEQIHSMEKHLTSCTNCRQYQRILFNLQNSVKLSPKKKLQPDPSIRRNVIKRMKKVKAEQQIFLSRLLQNIWKFLDYRIPVYQSIVGFVIILLVFIAVNYFSVPKQSDFKNTTETVQTEEIQTNQINILDNLQMIENQKIGKTVQEDTILTRFVVSVM